MSDAGTDDAADVIADLEESGPPEEITAADLERLRESLPTDPESARVINRALPFPWGEVFEYVSPSDRQSGYWRVAPDRRESPPDGMREAQEELAAASQSVAGTEGTVERDGKRVPRNAAAIADRLQGRRLSVARARASGEKALRRLRDVLGR